jgi:16S rRNA (cytosine1402-N4)-methyltransferase
MRFDRTRGKTAQDLIETLDEKELMRIMYVYADEKKAPFIARAIVEERAKKPIQTTFELCDLIEKASFDPKSAPRVFQAFRIAVNDEF